MSNFGVRKAFLIYLFTLALLTSCTIHRPGLISQANIGPKETPIAIAQGESRAFYILFFGPFGDNSLAAAVEDAKRNAGADTMLNVFADREVFTFLFLFTQSTTKVYGTLVNYNPPLPKREGIRRDLSSNESIKSNPAPRRSSEPMDLPL